MAWPNPFYRTTPNTRDAWGYRFELTPEHPTPETYDHLKHSYDTLGEQTLEKLNAISPPTSAELPRNKIRRPEHQKKADAASVPAPSPAPQSYDRHATRDVDKENLPVPASTPQDSPGIQAAAPTSPKRDLYALLAANHASDPTLSAFWAEIHTVPAWVDWAQISRGQQVFYRYGGAALTGLAYQSLLGGMGAARVVETLARTGGFSTKVARGRLFETTQHILQCTRSLEGMQPGGEGWASTVRVRLLHAAVRKRIMALEAARPGYFDVGALGVPVNDLDSVATISVFSASLIWLSLPRQGIFVRAQEAADYVALWRYVAHVIGCPTEPFETPEAARRVFESLLLWEVRPSATSQVLANNIIKSLADTPPGYASADMLVAGARWLNGNALADALDLPRPGLYYWFLMAGQCLFFCFWSYVYRAVPAWDERKIEMLRRVFWQIAVESKYGLGGAQSAFEFKYVPEYETITALGKGGGKAELKYTGVERRNLKTVAVAGVVLGVGVWCVIRVGLSVVRGFVGLVGW